MAHYLVTARMVSHRLAELRGRLDAGEIAPMRPFGSALHHSLTHARRLPDGRATWEEEDYCRPPLAMERAAVLDDYFTDLAVEPVTAGEGWRRVDDLPSLWLDAVTTDHDNRTTTGSAPR
jgi:hypothetical protein